MKVMVADDTAAVVVAMVMVVEGIHSYKTHAGISMKACYIYDAEVTCICIFIVRIIFELTVCKTFA
jgi:hypothetical protein